MILLTGGREPRCSDSRAPKRGLAGRRPPRFEEDNTVGPLIGQRNQPSSFGAPDDGRAFVTVKNRPALKPERCSWSAAFRSRKRASWGGRANFQPAFSPYQMMHGPIRSDGWEGSLWAGARAAKRWCFKNCERRVAGDVRRRISWQIARFLHVTSAATFLTQPLKATLRRNCWGLGTDFRPSQRCPSHNFALHGYQRRALGLERPIFEIISRALRAVF